MKLTVVLVSILLFSCFLVVNVPTAEAQGWLTGWSYRKSHVINPASGAGTNYQVRIVAHYGSGTDSGEDVYLNGKCRTDFGDIRFTCSDGTTLLSYWMEEKVDSDYAIFWVKVADDLSTNAVTIYIYYGNLSATMTSNPDATLIKYCGFEDGTLSPFNNIYPNDIFSVSSTVKKWGNYGAQANDPSSVYGGGRYSSANTFWALNKVAIEFWMRTDATSTSGGECSVYFTKNGYLRATLSIRDNGVFSYWDGSAHTFGSSSKGTWYKFVVELDYDNLKFNFRIYDASRNLLYSYTNIGMGSMSVSYADVMMYSSGLLVGLSYWDEFFSRKWVSPEPSHGSWGSEEVPKAWNDVETWFISLLTMKWNDVENWFVNLWTMAWRNVEEWSFQFIVLVCHTIEEWFVNFWTLEAIYIPTPTIKWGMVFTLAIVFGIVFALIFEEGKKK